MPEKALILELHQLINLDATGLDALETIRKSLQKHGSKLILCGLNRQPRDLMRRSGFLDRLGVENCLPNLQSAITVSAAINE